MSTLTTKNLARLAEAAFERRGDYPALLFGGRWHRSGGSPSEPGAWLGASSSGVAPGTA